MSEISEKTKWKLKQAFLSLYHEKDIPQITIKDITDEANLYRGTFYYYYEDIYDLYRQIQDEFVKQAQLIIENLVELVFSDLIDAEVQRIEDFMIENEPLLFLFLVKRPHSLVLEKLKEHAKSKGMQKLSVNDSVLCTQNKYLLEYVANAQIALWTMWIKNSRNISLSEVLQITKRANFSGAVTELRRNLQQTETTSTL